jgi:hypothetical protein
MTLVKADKAGFIKDLLVRDRDSCLGNFQWARGIVLNSESNEETWEFIPEEQSGVSGWKITEGKH